MYDYFYQYSSIENPTFETVVFTVLFAFLLSTAIAFTYELSSGSNRQGGHFVQSLVLSSIVAATIVQAIGDSVATGLGMLAALAIIRFRTTFRDARDIIFMFAALGAGIGVGVYGYTIALTGTAGFCAIALILRFTPLHRNVYTQWQLRFRVAPDFDKLPLLEEILEKHCRLVNRVGIRKTSDGLKGERMDYEFHIILAPWAGEMSLYEALEAVEGVEITRLVAREETTGLQE